MLKFLRQLLFPAESVLSCLHETTTGGGQWVIPQENFACRGVIMASRNDILCYFIEEYFCGDTAKAAETTGYAKVQIEAWLNGDKQPQKQTIEYFLHCIFTPQFKVIVEFKVFDPNKRILTQLKSMLKRHEDNPGIYAFYDSMANLIYLRKAQKLLKESYDAIRLEVNVAFSAGINVKPNSRHQIVRYISAYDIRNSNWLDYPRHVESLILRISKPLLNKNIGYLEKAFTTPQEG